MSDSAQPDVLPMPGADTPTTEIVTRTSGLIQRSVDVMPLMNGEEIEGAWRIANALAASRMFKDTYQATQCFAKIIIGRDLGLSPSQAMMSLDLVEGGIQMRGVLLLSFIRRHADYDYEIVSWDQDAVPVGPRATAEEIKEEDEQHCTLRFLRRDQVTNEMKPMDPLITFKTKQARHLKSFKEKMPWFTARGNLLLWRAASNGCKVHAPEIFLGMPIYTEADEFSSSTDRSATGDITEVAPEDLVIPWPQDVELSARLQTALERIHRHEPNSLQPAELQMRLGGQDDATLARLADEWELHADLVESKQEEEEPADAEVVYTEEEIEAMQARRGELGELLDGDSGGVSPQDLADWQLELDDLTEKLGSVSIKF